MQSPSENYFNLCQQHKEKRGAVKTAIILASNNFIFRIYLMGFTFKKNNKRTKKPVNLFLKDGAIDGIRSLQTSIAVIKLCQTPENRL